MSETRDYYEGKYTVRARADGGLEFLRHHEAWPACDDLRFSNLIGCMFREQLDADAELATLRQKLAEAEKERDDYRESFKAELRGAEALREELGARQDETFFMFARRLAKERNNAVENCKYANAFADRIDDEARARLATAEADCAAMRGALLGLIEVAENHHEERKCAVIGAGTMMNASFAQPMVVGWFDALVQNSKAARAALTRPTGQAILNELVAARKVCDRVWEANAARCQRGENVIYLTAMEYHLLDEELAAYIELKAARKANTGANHGKL